MGIIVLCAILCGGYYITFRGLLLTLFSYRFCNILRKQYGHSETVRFDGAIARYHAGGVPSYIGSHFHQQMSTSSRVGFPIGVVWALFILACLSYLPAFWIQGLIFSGGIALTCSIASIVALLPPSSDEDVKISSWKGSPLQLHGSPCYVFVCFHYSHSQFLPISQLLRFFTHGSVNCVGLSSHIVLWCNIINVLSIKKKK